mmetsp:Transcript_18740/g.61132  ORF Transcript_18740/g.61132 Transcript_18740/m.61132 type:complete len:204 (+) Transcript_18740:62-673(+)
MQAQPVHLCRPRRGRLSRLSRRLVLADCSRERHRRLHRRVEAAYCDLPSGHPMLRLEAAVSRVALVHALVARAAAARQMQTQTLRNRHGRRCRRRRRRRSLLQRRRLLCPCRRRRDRLLHRRLGSGCAFCRLTQRCRRRLPCCCCHRRPRFRRLPDCARVRHRRPHRRVESAQEHLPSVHLFLRFEAASLALAHPLVAAAAAA